MTTRGRGILTRVKLLDEVAAVRLAELAGLGLIDAVQPLPPDRWLLDHRRADPASGGERPTPRELLVVDQALQPVWRLRPPPAPPFWHAWHAVADDLSLAALAQPREVRVVDRDGGTVARFPYPAEHDTGSVGPGPEGGSVMVRLPGQDELLTVDPAGKVTGRLSHPGVGEAGGCAFSADRRRLWACVPRIGAGGKAWHELWLIDLAGRRVVDRRPLDFYAQVVGLSRHPDGQTIRVSLAYGQETAVRWARSVDGRIELLDQAGQGRPGAVHPAGSEYLTTPEEDGPEELVRHQWPDGAVLARLPVAAVDTPAGYWTAGTYLTGDLLLAAVRRPAEDREQHLLLAREPLRPLGRIRYPAGATPPGSLGPARDGAWLTVDAFQGTVDRWTLVPADRSRAAPTGAAV
jgi:hypothetical protein